MLRAFETFRCLSLVGFLTFTWACLSSGTIFAKESNATEPFPIDAEKRDADAFEKLADEGETLHCVDRKRGPNRTRWWPRERGSLSEKTG